MEGGETRSMCVLASSVGGLAWALGDSYLAERSANVNVSLTARARPEPERGQGWGRGRGRVRRIVADGVHVGDLSLIEETAAPRPPSRPPLDALPTPSRSLNPHLLASFLFVFAFAFAFVFCVERVLTSAVQ